MPEPVRQPREEATFTIKETPSPEPRRTDPRFSVDLDVTMASDHNFYAGFAENISFGGLFVATHLVKPAGERMEVVLNLPDREEPIRAVGEVRWVRLYSEGSNVPPGMGIRFVELTPDSAAAIERFLKEREPLFYDDD